MKIPKPYFKDVPVYGDLIMEQVIVEYVYPLLSVLKDRKGGRYLCMCFDTRGAQRWLAAPISNGDLIRLLKDRIPLDSPFKKCGRDVIFAVRNYGTKTDSFQLFKAWEIPQENLPAPGEYLEAEEGEWDSYIRALNDEEELWRSTFEEKPVFIRSRPIEVSFRSRSGQRFFSLDEDFDSVPALTRESRYQYAGCGAP